MGNAIEEEGRELGPLPGPVFVDDFYYDYNFINFHEDLSYGPFEDPDSDLVGTGDWRPHPQALLLSPPRGPRSSPQSLLGLRMRGRREMGPLPLHQPGWPIPTPTLRADPWELLVNFLPRKMPPLAPQTLGSPACLGPHFRQHGAPAALGARTSSWEQRGSQGACRPLPRWGEDQ